MKRPDHPPTTTVVLAAGKSSRLGQPKQLLKFGPDTLLRRTLRAVIDTPKVHEVIVVLGANAEAIRPTIDETAAVVILNPDWAEGLSTSVRAGLQAARSRNPDLGSVLFTLADQPNLTPAALTRLIDTGVSSSGETKLVAAAYEGHPGAPCWVDSALFPQIETLRGDRGLRPLFRSLSPPQLKQIQLPELATDIDTLDDFRRFIANETR